jgi:hypothetical protein
VPLYPRTVSGSDGASGLLLLSLCFPSTIVATTVFSHYLPAPMPRQPTERHSRHPPQLDPILRKVARRVRGQKGTTPWDPLERPGITTPYIFACTVSMSVVCFAYLVSDLYRTNVRKASFGPLIRYNLFIGYVVVIYSGAPDVLTKTVPTGAGQRRSGPSK